MPAPFFCSDADYALFWCYFGQICIKFGANLIILKKYAETVPSKVAIWDEFSEQH